MKERGANIMPVIGFIIMILILFSGFMVYNNANADKGTGAGIISSTGSETEKVPASSNIVDDTDELSTYGKDLISINTSSVDVNIYTHARNSVSAFTVNRGNEQEQSIPGNGRRRKGSHCKVIESCLSVSLFAGRSAGRFYTGIVDE